MKKQLKSYFKEIKKNLPCVNSTMRKMLDDLKISVNAFIRENNISDFNAVIEHFGTAQDIAREFTAGLDNSYIKSYKFKKRIIAIVVSMLAVILVITSALMLYIIVSLENNTPVSEGTTIIYEEEEN